MKVIIQTYKILGENVADTGKRAVIETDSIDDVVGIVGNLYGDKFNFSVVTGGVAITRPTFMVNEDMNGSIRDSVIFVKCDKNESKELTDALMLLIDNGQYPVMPKEIIHKIYNLH